MNKSPMPASEPVRGHEERDANIRVILWFSAGLIATILAVLLLMKWAFHAFTPPESEAASMLSARGVINQPPPEPRLQVNAPEDLKRMREEEDALLNSYGWVDRQNGIVRIPIDRAIDLVARRGLPPRSKMTSIPSDK